VAQQARVTLAPAASAATGSRWSLTDMVVAAGIFLGASLLFFPAVSQSRFAAKVTDCQNNLRQIGMALRSYSTMYNRYFPVVPVDERCAAMGLYAPCLMDHKLVDSPRVFVCPASPLASQVVTFRVPSRVELRQATGEELARLLNQLGSYGYTMGYIANGQYRQTQNMGRPTFALMADAPSTEPPYHSLSHDGRGQNVLFDDFHVKYLTTCKAHGCADDIFTNDAGQVAPGLHAHDAVIAPNATVPVIPAASQPLPALSD
jgi:hypothetical protein